MSAVSSRAPSLAPSRSSSQAPSTHTHHHAHLSPDRPKAPSSPSSSIAPSSTTGAGGSAKKPAHHQHTTTAAWKLAHLFDGGTKYATFQVGVVLHDMGNVPQMDGEFVVKWKFRGKRPRGVDGSATPHPAPTPKPSLPNLKLSQPDQSASSLSIDSLSSTSSSPLVPQSGLTSGARTPVYPSKPSAHLGVGLPGRSATLPVPPTPLTSLAPPPAAGPSRQPSRVEKKASDPTPLRQSMRPADSPGPSPVTDSPETLEKPDPIVLNDEPEPIRPRKSSDETTTSRDTSGTGSTSTEGSMSLSGPSRLPSSSGSLLPPHHASSLPVHLRQGPPSAASSQSHLSVPFPRSASGHRPPARTGTIPSTSTIIEPLPNLGQRSGLSRQTSYSTTASTNGQPGHLPDGRPRSTSGLSAISSASFTQMTKPPPVPNFSNQRKGITFPAKVSPADHACTWDYRLEHVLRIPISKVTPKAPRDQPSGSTGFRPPILGFGPMSESGLRLEVEQLPVAGSGGVSALPAQGADKDSVSSMLAATRHANGNAHHGNPSEVGKRGMSGTTPESYGWVDIDLAMFAGRGRCTRRFLLKGRTNALVKITVEMRLLGGEEKWTAPALGEGQHVTGMTDLIGADTEDRINRDIALINPSHSNSSNSSLSGAQSPSRLSLASSVVDLTPNPTLSLAPLPRQSAYKTYEHHLLPQTPPPGVKEASHHRHSDQTSSSHASSHRQASVAGSTNSRAFGTSHDLAAETVIEAIFNPFPGREEGPFSYVSEGPEVPGQQGVLSTEPMSISDADRGRRGMEEERDSAEGTGEHAEQERARRFGFMRRARERKEREARQASGVHQAAAAPIPAGY